MNSPEDISTLLRDANNGIQSAQYRLALAYLQGDGARMDVEMAIRWFEEAAENGNFDAKAKLGQIFEERKDMVSAEKWYLSDIRENNAFCMWRLGYLIYKGKLGFRPTKEGLDLINRSAEMGQPDAVAYVRDFINRKKY